MYIFKKLYLFRSARLKMTILSGSVIDLKLETATTTLVFDVRLSLVWTVTIEGDRLFQLYQEKRFRTSLYIWYQHYQALWDISELSSCEQVSITRRFQ